MGEALRGSWLGSQEGTRRLGIQPTIWGTMVSYSDIASSKDSDVLLPAYITPINLSPAVYCRIGYDVGGLGTITSPPPADGGRCAWGECGVWRETHPRHTGAWRLERNNNGSELVDIQHRLYSPTGHHPLHRSESLAQPPPTGPCSTVWPPWSDLAFFLVETLGVGIS